MRFTRFLLALSLSTAVCANTVHAQAESLDQVAPRAEAGPVEPGRAIVMVPGLDTGSGSGFSLLYSVFHSSGLGALSYVGFSYNEPWNSSFDPTETCQPLQATENRLATALRTLRDTSGASSVVLVGHSLGGVAAFDVAATNPDLSGGPSPFIRGVVTLDSPLGGITALQRLVGWLGQTGACPVLSDLRARATPAWQQWLTDRANSLLARSVHLAIVTNPEDLAVLPQSQGISGAQVNYTLDYVDDLDILNHSAVLHSADALGAIASWINSW